MEKNNRKTIAYLLLAFAVLACSLAGCKEQSAFNGTSEHRNEVSEEMENPFGRGNPMEGFMNSISHGVKLDENERRPPLVYDGQEVRIEYYVNASGQGKNVGFLMYLDGVPQPYKIDNPNAPYEYMHIFQLEDDNANVPFTFIFSPLVGKQGKTLNLTVASVYNPSFIPDMEQSVSYGGYHSILPANYQLIFNADANTGFSSHITNEAIRSMTVTKEPVTNQLMDTVRNNGMREIDTDIFNSEIFTLIYYDGALRTDNYDVSGKETVRITYTLCGHGGLDYTTTFYVNHQPISSSDGVSVDVAIEKGFVSVIEVEIDVSKLSDFNTFYAVSVPKNAQDFPNGIFETIKTQSILLYK